MIRPEIALVGGLLLIAALYLINRPPHRTEMSSEEFWIQRQARKRDNYLED